MLSFDGVLLRQGDFTLAAEGDFAPGITAILGPSGGGKSTLLAAVAGFLRPAQGQILWDGAPMPPAPGQRPVGMIFQDNNLFPHLSIAQNVGLGLHPGLRLGRAEWDQVAEALRQVGLAGMEARKPGALSGGQQSRAALARVLVAGRPIVALDEPFAALGPALRAEMLALMAARLAGRLVLMVTHDPQDAQAVADAVAVVAEGRLEPPAPVGRCFADPSPALAAYLGGERFS